jgi:hypothetical protein
MKTHTVDREKQMKASTADRIQERKTGKVRIDKKLDSFANDQNVFFIRAKSFSLKFIKEVSKLNTFTHPFQGYRNLDEHWRDLPKSYER